MTPPPYRCLVQPDSPPSTYAIAAWMDGEPGAGWRTVGLTFERSIILATGLYLAGFRGKDLWRGAFVGGSAITGWILLDYWMKARRGKGLTPFSE